MSEVRFYQNTQDQTQLIVQFSLAKRVSTAADRPGSLCEPAMSPKLRAMDGHGVSSRALFSHSASYFLGALAMVLTAGIGKLFDTGV
jgi:hypothetical protein